MSTERLRVGKLEFNPSFYNSRLIPYRETRSSDQQPLTCNQLLREYYQRGDNQIQGWVLDTRGITMVNSRGRQVSAEVFNISGSFQVRIDGKSLTICAYRCDPPGTEGCGEVHFGVLENHSLVPLERVCLSPAKKEIKIKGREDPKRMQIGQSWFLSLVEVSKNGWRMGFYYEGDSLDQFRKFADGPRGMKGIVLAELFDNQVLIFTRPEGEYLFLNCDGKPSKVTIKEVGWTVVDRSVISDPKELKRAILHAQIISDLFAWGEWGGVNDAILLNNGKVGVLGHIAREDEKGNKHYYPITFEFDPQTGQFDQLRIIASKDNFPEAKGVAKKIKGKNKDYLEDVVYFNGMDAFRKITKEDCRSEAVIMIRYYGGAGDKVPVVFEKESHFSAAPVKII